MTAAEALKRAAAARALEEVEDGMRLGLGTGSTATYFVDLLGERVRRGLRVLCVPTSERTAAQARALAIPLSTLDDTPELDLTVDGADEIDPALALIKGGGGALLREKIVAAASARFVVIADAGKRVARLGRFPLPIEVNLFGLEATRRAIARAALSCGVSAEPVVRRGGDGAPQFTDGGHATIDLPCGAIPDAAALNAALFAVPGVVETGLFLGMCRLAIIADASGVALDTGSA